MRHLLTLNEQSYLQSKIIELLVSKKCTLSSFDELVDKVHQFYKDNATLNQSITTTNDIHTVHRRYRRKDTK